MCYRASCSIVLTWFGSVRSFGSMGAGKKKHDFDGRRITNDRRLGARGQAVSQLGANSSRLNRNRDDRPGKGEKAGGAPSRGRPEPLCGIASGVAKALKALCAFPAAADDLAFVTLSDVHE